MLLKTMLPVDLSVDSINPGQHWGEQPQQKQKLDAAIVRKNINTIKLLSGELVLKKNHSYLNFITY